MLAPVADDAVLAEPEVAVGDRPARAGRPVDVDPGLRRAGQREAVGEAGRSPARRPPYRGSPRGSGLRPRRRPRRRSRPRAPTSRSFAIPTASSRSSTRSTVTVADAVGVVRPLVAERLVERLADSVRLGPCALGAASLEAQRLEERRGGHRAVRSPGGRRGRGSGGCRRRAGRGSPRRPRAPARGRADRGRRARRRPRRGPASARRARRRGGRARRSSRRSRGGSRAGSRVGSETRSRAPSRSGERTSPTAPGGSPARSSAGRSTSSTSTVTVRERGAARPQDGGVEALQELARDVERDVRPRLEVRADRRRSGSAARSRSSPFASVQAAISRSSGGMRGHRLAAWSASAPRSALVQAQAVECPLVERAGRLVDVGRVRRSSSPALSHERRRGRERLVTPASVRCGRPLARCGLAFDELASLQPQRSTPAVAGGPASSRLDRVSCDITFTLYDYTRGASGHGPLHIERG